ncbi:hypothetical protein DPMN_141741 [Dreissena polymorpha]|uniref:IgGFc-binding protein N-terminal domain-containing protein n=1 Tax=Dreissena polymorpha TaxID=45954 RepID=A0A9D4JLJ7_DREPO|nr:hypothetical protein DPMN_141741 [Dreissena polymorpha]
MVSSAFTKAEVNISFPNGKLISKTLNWLDVYQEASLLTDLPGTLVQSSKPVSVVSGASCARVSTSLCDMACEQMIPTNAFQTYFIVPPILSEQFMVFMVFSSESNNKVCVKDVLFENCKTMGWNQWLQSKTKNSSLVVTSQEPISVIQYKGVRMYMAIIPGIRQFMNSYTFVVPEIYVHHDYYISVIILSSASQSLRLDGTPPIQLNGTFHVEPPFDKYTVLTFRITTRYHVMTSTEIHVVFGLIVFGIDYKDGAFGYPAGINFGKFL